MTTTEPTVYFYSDKENNYEFSNYYMVEITIDGKTYPSSEHYYQAQKFLGPNPSPANQTYAELIRLASTANKARVLAQQKVKGGHQAAWYLSATDRRMLNDLITQSLANGVAIREEWEQHKDEVMRIAVNAKFSQHKNLKKQLLKTKSSPIAEKSPIDSYWGLGPDGKGKNRLGIILMEQRTKCFKELEQVEPKEEPQQVEPKEEPKTSKLTFNFKAI